MKIFQAFLFFALVLFIKADSSDDPCFDFFQGYLEDQCEKLKYNDTYGCEYLNGNCIMKQSCESYKGTDENTCKSIKPSDYSKKCVMKNNQCTEVTKSCSEYEKGKNECTSLDAGANKRCILQGDSCTAMENTCDLLGTNQEYCEKIIPLDVSIRCVWSSGTCSSVKKKCNEVNSYYDSCSDLETSNENARCEGASNRSNGCKERYDTCEHYNNNAQNKNKDDCEEIISFYDGNPFICVFENGNCNNKAITCDFFNYKSTCNYYELDEKRICIYINGKCEEQYKTCEIYNQEKTKEKGICEKIIPFDIETKKEDPYSKCVYDNAKNTCEKKEKGCSEIKDKYKCIEYELNDENKMCVYENDKCKEEYKSCSHYNNNPSKTPQGCKSIKIYSGNSRDYIDHRYKCVYDNNQCKQKQLKKCEDYEEGTDEDYCNRIENDIEKCIIKNGNCVKQYIDCPQEAEENDCPNIELAYDQFKCIYDKDNGCIRETKKCSEYKGISKSICEKSLISSDKDKKCFMINGKCTENYINCESYKGNNREACESIIPYDDKGNSLKSQYKCILDEKNTCIKKEKECHEANTYEECKNIIEKDNKKCIYLDGVCKEQYKDCDSYTNSGETIDKNVCEAIILNEIDLSSPNPLLFNEKCVFIQGEGQNPNKCQKREKTCSDFKPKDYSSLCLEYSNTLSFKEKCVFSDSKCSIAYRSCSELDSNEKATKEICENAPTSNAKICKLKEDYSGCIEVEKENKSIFGPAKNLLYSSLLFIILDLLV